jgi:DNA-binding beta-propeller fold protein YncE
VADKGGSIWFYRIDGTTGALTPDDGDPIPTGDAVSVAVDPTGQFLYVANAGFQGEVSAWTIDPTTGAPYWVDTSLAGGNPISVTVDPTGQFAYVANHDSANVSAYTIDGTTGALTEIAGSPFPSGVNPFSVTTTAGPPPAVP